jgi:hypothetical protein
MSESSDQALPVQPEEAGEPVANPEDEGGNVVDLLLREPSALLARFDGSGRPRLFALLLALALGGHCVYALVMAGFAGGLQWWAVPLKVTASVVLCGAICFPSLYILVCLSGARARLQQVAGMLFAFLALSATFLAGCAPIAWVFSQSSTLVSFIGAVHLLVWLISIFASARILARGLRHWRARHPEWATLWLMIFVVTSLQMTTVLRPMVGPATRLFEPERQFFLVNWLSTMSADAKAAEE